MHGDSLGYQNAHRGDADSEKCFGPLLYAGVHGGPGKMAQHADGVIVGSAIVRQIGELGEESQLYKLGNSLLENSEVAEPTGFEYFGGSVEMSGQVPGVVGIAAHCDDLASQFLITSENSGAGMKIPKTAYDAAGIQLQSLFFFQQKLQNPVQNIAVFLVGVLPVL